MQPDENLIPPEPPVPLDRIIKVGGVGWAFVLVALTLGVIAPGIPGAQVILSAIALVIAGSAISLRPTHPVPWALAGGIGVLTRWAFPDSWDSMQFLGTVLGCLALIGSVLLLVPLRYRLAFLVLATTYHYSGILLAMSSPPPTPWLTSQFWPRYFRPYLFFC